MGLVFGGLGACVYLGMNGFINTMKRIEFAFLLTCFCFLFTGCEKDDELMDRDTVHYPSGYIMAGETGDRVRVWDFGDGNTISSNFGGQTFRHSLDDTLAGKISFGTGADYFMYGYNVVSGIYSTDPTMEFALTSVTDSSWVCYDLSPDSMSGHIWYGNIITEANCPGQRYFDHMDSIQSPTAFDAGMRLDAGLRWKREPGNFYVDTNYNYSSGVFQTWSRLFSPWSAHPDKQFIAFRYPRENGNYRYGYAEVTVAERAMTIHRIGVEIH
jgi:hypothetical protein